MAESTVRQIDLLDRATELSSKLKALLAMTYGAAGESFRGMSDELQDEYLWACAGMADELKSAVYELATASVP